MYVATPEAKNPTLEETFPSDPFAAATRLPKVIGYIYVTTYAMSLLPNRIDQHRREHHSCRRTVRSHCFHNFPCNTIRRFFHKIKIN